MNFALPPLTPLMTGLAVFWFWSLQITVLENAPRFLQCIESRSPALLFTSPDLNYTFFLPTLLITPLCCCVRFRQADSPTPWQPTAVWHMAVLLYVATLAAATSGTAGDCEMLRGKSFAEVTPLIHDEFSYLLQARSFLEARWSWPGPPAARELFHQMHVLNEGQFASRYPPGTGLWILPFLSIGAPEYANYVAFMIVCVLVYGIGCRLDGPIAGLIAGTATALSPGMAFFSNLMLSHLPCLLGIAVFLRGMQSFIDRPSVVSGLIAGAGLSFAMLTRPLTAAAIGLPFGLWILLSMIRGIPGNWSGTLHRWRWPVVAMSLPLLAGMALLVAQSSALCGTPTRLAWSEYQRLYTPRHAFGFDNGVRGDRETPPGVLREYNDWAENLDGRLAWQNLVSRLSGSVDWSIGRLPVLLAIVLTAFTASSHSVCLWLILAAGITLHVAHTPYWFAGILGFHYAFESMLVWLILAAYAGSRLIRESLIHDRLLLIPWTVVLLATPVISNFSDSAMGHAGSRLTSGIRNFSGIAERYETFRDAMSHADIKTPALVLLKTHPGDLHVEYIRNDPTFQAPVLYGKWNADLYSAEDIRRLCPDRTIYVYSTTDGRLERP